MENINKTKNRWWWIRHAPVVNPGKKLYGQSDLDVDLSNDRRFESLATALPKNAVWITTPLRRARETARWLAKLTEYKGTIEEYDQLKEQDFGDWEGKTWGDVPIKDSETFWNNPVENCIPNGESFKDVMSRVGHLVEQLNRRHNGRDIIAVAHMGTIRAAVMLASDEKRNTKATVSHTPTKALASGQAKPSSTPIKVATPLPPLNLKNTGNK